MQSTIRIFIVACLIAFFTGCIKQQTVVKVKKDGSGSLAVTTIFSSTAVTMIEEQMKAVEAQFANSDMDFDLPTDLFYNEPRLSAEAARYGDGVKFVKAKPYNKNGARGAVALYSFDDVSKLLLPSKGFDAEAMAPAMAGQETTVNPPEASDAYTFELGNKDDDAVLTIKLPDMPEAIELDKEQSSEEITQELNAPIGPEEMAMYTTMGNPLGLTGNETHIEVMEKMMGDMKTTLTVIVDGKIKKTNATYRNKTKPNRITLLSMDFSELFSGEKVPALLSMFEKGDPTAMMSESTAYRLVPGFEVETNNPVVIEFQ